MKYLVAVVVVLIFIAGCGPSASNSINPPQQSVSSENKSISTPPLIAVPAKETVPTNAGTANNSVSTTDIIDNTLQSTALIFSTAHWFPEEAEEGFWYEIEMLKPILTSRSSTPLHWLQHQNTRPWKQGSGVVIDKKGYILTSRRVIEDCDEPCGDSLTTVGHGAQFIYVFLYENGELTIDKDHAYIATVICRHPQDDLAVIKITPRNGTFPYLPIGDSSLITKGQQIMAAGYPNNMLYAESFSAYKWKTDTIGFNCEPTFVDGVVSAIRKFDTYPMNYTMDELNADYKVTVIQTNADINYGMAGGPLVDKAGKVIGVIAGRVFGAPGLGFAIGINEANDLIKSALARPIEGIKDGTVLSCEPGDPCYSQTAWEADPIRRLEQMRK